MTVIAVGHTHTKFSNLLSLIPDEYTVVRVFNGENKRDDSFYMPNDPLGRDVSMYKKGVDMCPGENRFVFLNDDVQHLSREWWKLAHMFLYEWKQTPDVVGVANLSSWVDKDKLDGHSKRHAISQGTQPMFIRTSAFMATKGHFYNVYAESEGNAQTFEKGSLVNANRAHLIPPQWAYDSNVAKYV